MVLLILRWSLVHSVPELTGRTGNELTLICRDNSDIAQLANAEFWLNSTRLTDLLPTGSYELRSDIGKIEFTINPDLEGYFYCGSDTSGRSINALELTGKLTVCCMYCLVASVFFVL